MSYCACGNLAEANGTHCASCAALQCLDLRLGASKLEIQKAFETLSTVWQPERFTDDPKTKAIAADKLERIKAAHDYLMTHAALPGAFRASAVNRGSSQPAMDTQISAGAIDLALPNLPAPIFPAGKSADRDVAPTRRIAIPPGIVLGLGVMVAGLTTLFFIYKPMDAALLANPATSGWYREYKASLGAMLGRTTGRISNDVASLAPTAPATQNSNTGTQAQTQSVAESPVKPAQKRVAASPAGSARGEANATPASTGHLAALVTTGMTKSELIAAEGEPTSARADTLAYGNSEFYFRGDSLTGWKIDPVAPIRVKIWPEGHVSPDLTSFGVGSSKNDVIALQGTPSYLTIDKFGYGASEVYFVSNRVVGWKNDASAPLHIAR